MTEKQAWLKIGHRCLDTLVGVFLCHEVRDISVPTEIRRQMQTRLRLFRPLKDSTSVAPWWLLSDFDNPNKPRATACYLLASMCDD